MEKEDKTTAVAKDRTPMDEMIRWMNENSGPDNWKYTFHESEVTKTGCLRGVIVEVVLEMKVEGKWYEAKGNAQLLSSSAYRAREGAKFHAFEKAMKKITALSSPK